MQLDPTSGHRLHQRVEILSAIPERLPEAATWSGPITLEPCAPVGQLIDFARPQPAGAPSSPTVRPPRPGPAAGAGAGAVQSIPL